MSIATPVRTRLFKVRGQLEGPAFERESGSCVPLAEPEDKVLLRLEEIPLDTLAPVRARTDD